MERTITIDDKRYMHFGDLYKIYEFEENTVIFEINIDESFSEYTFRMELENRKATNTKDMVYLSEDNTITIPVDMLVKGLLKFQGVFLKDDNIVAKTNRISLPVTESINADNYIAETYSNVIQEMRSLGFTDVDFNVENDEMNFYNIDGELVKSVGLSTGGLSHEVIDEM